MGVVVAVTEPDRERLTQIMLDLPTLSSDEIASLISELELAERSLSERRRFLHEHIDRVKERMTALLRERISSPDADFADAALLRAAEAMISSSHTIPVEALLEEGEAAPVELPDDVASLSFEELERLYQSLRREEARVSYRRRVTQGTIDILKNELLARLESTSAAAGAATDEELVRTIARVLAERGF